MTRRTVLPLALTALLATSGVDAQTSVIDEGSFSIAVRGNTVGTETFTIRRRGSGANATTVAQGRVNLDTGGLTRAIIELRGDGLRPAAYQIETTGADARNITGRATGSRFRATVVSGAGERMREFLVDPNAIVLFDAVVHPYFFVAAAVNTDGRFPVVLPHQSRQVMATVTLSAREPVQIAGQQVSASRILIEIPGMDPRTVWVDSQHRVLRLRIPQQDLLAERTALP